MDDRYTPTLKQILDKADSLMDEAMTAEEAAEWYRTACEDAEIHHRRMRRLRFAEEDANGN